MNPVLDFLVKQIIKKKEKDPKNLLAKMPDEDFIPYVCHYDPNTILTKNGELLQIIRITGFSHTTIVSEMISLRDAVRSSITNNITESNVAFWFNTIRRKKNINPKGKFDDFFSQKIDQTWNEENKLDDQYVNELYITIIIEGIDTSISNATSFFRSFSYSSIKSLHRQFLEKSHQKLSEITQKILVDVEDYGAILLGIQEWNNALFSQPMRFFGKIVNLYENRYPLACNDISSEMSSHKIAFGDRELQVVGNNNKNFAAIFSLKEYFEVSTQSLDKILQLPFEFIITQSFDFSFSKKDLENFEYQDYILKVSGDEEFRQLSGAANFVESNKNHSTDYGKQQITIMLICKTHEELEIDAKMLIEQFSALGFVIVREDIFLEHCFWAQLPANFKLLKRQKIINTNRIAGFAALHSFPFGSISANHWGPAVSALKTILDTPYFFNFHDGNLGHTLFFGQRDETKIAFLHFLLLQSRRFNNRLVYFDFDNRAKPLIKGLLGNYYQASRNQLTNGASLNLNPLKLENNQNKAEFLTEFFTSLIYYSAQPVPENEIALIARAVDQMITSNIEDFAKACQVFDNVETATIYRNLNIWTQGALKNIFASAEEINFNDKIFAVDLTEVLSQKAVLIPLMLYMLKRVEESLDGSPTIIVISEAFDVFDNEFFKEKVVNLLKRLQQKNCTLVMTSSNFEIKNYELIDKINKNCATKIFMPHKQLGEIYSKGLSLNADEISIIEMMEEGSFNMLLKHGDDSIIIDFDYFALGQLYKILAPDEVALAVLDEVNLSKENGGVELWLNQMIEVLQALEDEEIAAKKEQAKLA
jgi:type IV secretion system protein VirB4